MNVGLLYTPVSIYQMTRGALVLFVGILSVVFLRRRLHLYQYAHTRFSITCLRPPRLLKVALIGDGYGWRIFSRLKWFSRQGYPPLDCPFFCQHVRSDSTYYRYTGRRDHRGRRGSQGRYWYLRDPFDISSLY
jgi:hypothetical protein